ncbi:MAG: DUF3794 domain-containing protein [Bacillota bacterium]|nr:DUF3794 domain-containing protein [Bacillota bacterium]
MEISLNRKSMSCLKKAYEPAVYCESMAECVVPDVQDDIRQVLTTTFITKIRSKDIDIDEINIKAELNAVVMYYSENGIDKLEIPLPVNAKIPAKDIDSSCIISADIKIVSWDVRVINPRKVSLKAEVNVKASCYRESELVWYESPDELSEKVFVKSDSAVVSIVDTVAEKTITADDEFDLDGASDLKLLSAFAAYRTESSETVGDKLIMRGRADIDAVYLSDGRLVNGVFSIPFSQLFDVSGDDSGECEAAVLSTGEYYDIVDGKLSAELHAVIQMVYRKKIEISFASDAYSCCCDTTLQYEPLEFCAESDAVSLKEGIQLTFDSTKSITELLLYRAYIAKNEALESGVTTTVVAELIYRDAENEVNCGKIRGNIEFPLENSTYYKSLCSEIAGIRAVTSGNSIDIRGEVRLTAKRDDIRTLNCVPEIVEGEAFSGDSPAAYIVFSDEDIWNIAKKYRSDCDKISVIDSEDSMEKPYKKLFVPVIK